MEDLTEISKSIINTSFPELQGFEINVRYADVGDTYFTCYQKNRTAKIKASERLKEAPLQALRGGLAHEFAHACIESGFNRLRRKAHKYLSRYCSRYLVWYERKTDIFVVQRDLGKELLAFSDWCDEQEKDIEGKFNPEFGLTTQELEALVKI